MLHIVAKCICSDGFPQCSAALSAVAQAHVQRKFDACADMHLLLDRHCTIFLVVTE